MNAMVKELYLDHHFSYRYGRRGSIHASLGTGLTNLSLYKNGDGVRILKSRGLGLHFGLGWKLTLLGRDGERIRIGIVGYGMRGPQIFRALGYAKDDWIKKTTTKDGKPSVSRAGARGGDQRYPAEREAILRLPP